LKIFHINSYTEYECNNKLVSKELLPLIENTLKLVPHKKTSNIEENLPSYINNIKSQISDENFKKWRNSYSNTIDDIYIYLPFYNFKNMKFSIISQNK